MDEYSYYHEVSYKYVNYQGVCNVSTNNEQLTKTQLLDIKDSIEKNKDKESQGILIIENIITVLNN